MTTETIEVEAKINKKDLTLLVSCRELSPEYVQIESVRDKYSNKLLTLPENILTDIENIIMCVASIELASKREYIAETASV